MNKQVNKANELVSLFKAGTHRIEDGAVQQWSEERGEWTAAASNWSEEVIAVAETRIHVMATPARRRFASRRI